MKIPPKKTVRVQINHETIISKQDIWTLVQSTGPERFVLNTVKTVLKMESNLSRYKFRFRHDSISLQTGLTAAMQKFEPEINIYFLYYT